MRSPTRILLLLVLAAAAVALPAGSASADPGAQASRSCSTGSGRGLGPTYAFRLRVLHTSCRNGRKLIRSYYNCRKANGGRDGHCRRTLGYRCSERRYNKSRLSYDANVRCKKGSRRINHTYTQNLR